jgi:hypothetical protein
MERYGEYLFGASSGSIKQCMDAISEDEVRDCSDFQVFKRGKEYYRSGLVEHISYREKENTVEAAVAGTDLYRLEFYVDHREVWATCDCPYDDVCKHMVAMLLKVVNEGAALTIDTPEGLPSPEETSTIIRKHLKSLTKSKLVDLVIKHAPIEYLEGVLNRNSPGIDASAIFKKAEKTIQKCFKDDELLFDPYGMEDVLMKNLLKLKGLESALQKELGELLLYIIRSVEEAFNEGYLYIDSWPDDTLFESEEFCAYVIAYVNQLPFQEKSSYILQLDHELNRMSYDTFYEIEESYHKFFREDEKKQLLKFIEVSQVLPASLLSRLYEFLVPELSDQEKELMLRKLTDVDQKHVSTLCELLFRQERYQETYDLLMKHLPEKGLYVDKELVLFYLDASKKLGHNPVASSKRALNWRPSLLILEKIKELYGTVDAESESIVRNDSPEDLLGFFEQEKRMEEALQLVLEADLLHESTRFAFYRKHRKRFPEQSEAFLVERIEKNLPHTGKSYYKTIAESLDLLKRVNPRRCAQIAGEIRTNFKRRTNLMQVIKEI